MALNIMQKIKPVGTFPAVDAEDVLMPDGTRLSKLKLTGDYLPLTGGEITGELVVKSGISVGRDSSEENINLVNESPDDATPVLSFFGSQSDDPVRLYNIANPVEASDAATKEYVDNHSASVTVDSELSITSENPVQNKVVTTNFNGAMQTLQNNVLPNLLPAVTSADNGKVLAAVGGKWTPVAVAVPDDAYINALIDAKLGVIENGAY